MENLEETEEMDMIILLNAIKKIIEVSSNPTEDVLDYINDLLEQI